MKQDNNKQVADVSYLELFKKSLALSFTVFLFGAQQSYANNNITPGGNYGTVIEGGNTNNTNITGGTVNNGTGFHHFDRFEVGQGGTANLIFAQNADRYVNMVNNQVSIYGIFNSLKNGQIGGNVIFVSPMGLVVGSSGIMNVGSLQSITPSPTDYNRVLGTTNFSDISSLTSNSQLSSTSIDGKIFAQDSVKIADGRSVMINKNADIVSGFNQDGFAKTQLRGFNMNQIVNSDGVVDAAYMTEGAGSIEIVASNIDSVGVASASPHVIQSSGDITFNTPEFGDISNITIGSKMVADGDINIGNNATQSGTGAIIIENDLSAKGSVDVKAMATVTQRGDITAGNNVDVHAAIYNQSADSETVAENGTITLDGASNLGKVTNKNGNIDINAAMTETGLVFNNTVTAENGNINVSSILGNITQSDGSFDALKTGNGGKLGIRTYTESQKIGTAEQALNLNIDGNVDISSVRGEMNLNSDNASLKLGNISGATKLNATTAQDLVIGGDIVVEGTIDFEAQKGITQKSEIIGDSEKFYSITSTGAGDITIKNGQEGAISIGDVKNYAGDINLSNEAAGEKLILSRRLEAAGNINLSSNAGIEQTATSSIGTSAAGDITMTNGETGNISFGNVYVQDGGMTITNNAEDGKVLINQDLTTTKDINISSKAGIEQKDGSYISVYGDKADVNITNEGKGDISIGGDITNTGGNIIISNTIVGETDTGNVNLGGGLHADDGYVSVKSDKDIIHQGSITAGGKNGYGQSVILSANDNIVLESINAAYDVDITTGSTTLNNLIQSTDGSISITTENDLVQNVTGKTLDAGKDITLNVDGNIGVLGENEQSIVVSSGGKTTLKGNDINVSSENSDITFGKVDAAGEVKLSSKNNGAPAPTGKITLSDTVNGTKITIDSVKDAVINSDVTAENGIVISANDGITQSSSSTITNTQTGDVRISNKNTGNVSTGNINVSDGKLEVTNSGSGSVNLDGVYNITNGGVSISAGGDIIQNENVLKSIIADGNVSLESLNGSIGNDSRFITMETQSGISAKAADGSVYLKTIGSDLIFNEDSEIVFGKDIGLGSDHAVIIEKEGGITADNGSIYIDSHDRFNLDKDLTAKNYIEIKGANGINLQDNSTLRTTGIGENTGNISLINAGDSPASGSGAINVNNITSTGKITITSDNAPESTDGVNINGNASLQAVNGIDITSNTGINQNSGSLLSNSGNGDINIVNAANALNLGNINNANGNINVSANQTNAALNLNGRVEAQNGSITLTANSDIVKNSAEAFLNAGEDITLNAIGDVGSQDSAISLNSSGLVTSSGENIYLESPDKDININTVSGSGNVNIKTSGNSGSVNIQSQISGENVVINAIDSIVQNEDTELAVNAVNNLAMTSQKGSIGSALNKLDIASGGEVSAIASQGEIGLNSVNKNLNLSDVISSSDINISSTGEEGQITANKALSANNGSVNIDSTQNIVLKDNVSGANGVTLNAQTGIVQESGSLTSANGDITVNNAQNGNISLQDIIANLGGASVSNKQDGNILINNINTGSDAVVSSEQGNITINEISSSSGLVNLSTQAGGSIDVSNVNAYENIDISAIQGGNVTTGDLTSTQGGVTVSTTQNGTLTTGNIDANQNVKISAKDGEINVNNVTSSLSSVDISTSLGGAINASDITAFGDVNVSAAQGGNVITGDLTSENGAVNAYSTLGGILDIQDVTANQNVTLSTEAGNLSAGSVSSTASSVNISTNLGGAISANNVNSADNITINTLKGGNVSILDAVSQNGNVNIGATLDGTISAHDVTTANGNITLASEGGNVGLNNASATNGNVVINTGNVSGEVTISGNVNATGASQGRVDITAGSNIIQSGIDNVISAENEINLTSAAGNIGTSDSNSIRVNISNENGIFNADALNGSVFAQTTGERFNIGTVDALNNVGLKANGSNSVINITESVTGGNVALFSSGDILQSAAGTSIISDGTVNFDAKGNVGSSDSAMKVSSGDLISGNGNNIYIDTPEGDLNAGKIIANGEVVLSATNSGASVSLNDVVKGGNISITANRDITQDASLEKSIDASGDVSLIAQNGNIGTPKTDSSIANAIDLSAGGRITASAAQGSVIINGVDSSIQTDNILAKNDIDLTTTHSGSLIVSNDLTTNSGYIRLNSAEDLSISNNISAFGDVILGAANGINQTGGEVKSTGTGNVSITNTTRNDVNLGKVSAENGNISITNDAQNADVKFNETLSASNGSVSINSKGKIQQNTESVGIISGGNIELNAAQDVASGADMTDYLTVSTDGTISGSGRNFYVDNIDNNLVAGRIDASGDVKLKAASDGKSVHLTGLIDGQNVTILANNNITQDSALEKSINAISDVNLTAQHGNVGTPVIGDTPANAIDLTAGGTIKASAAEGSVVINGVDSSIVTNNFTAKNDIDLTTTNSGSITISSALNAETGYIRLDSAEDLKIENDIIANGNVILEADKGINHVSGEVSSESGNVSVTNVKTGSINLGNVISNAGGIDVTNFAEGENIQFNGIVKALDGSNGNITVSSKGAITQAAEGQILTAGKDITLNAKTSVSSAYGDGLFLVNSGGVVNAAGERISIASPDMDLNLGTVNGTGNVDLKTTGSGSVNFTGKVSGENININAVDDITQNEDIDIAIEATENLNLTSQNGSIGTNAPVPNAIDIAAGGSVNASAQKGSVSLNSVNKDLSLDNVLAANDINISSTGSDAGNININSEVLTTNGVVKIDSSKSVALNDNVSANKGVTVKAQTGINQSQGNISSTEGNVEITNTVSGDTNLNSVYVSNGNILVDALESTGNVVFSGELSALSQDTQNGSVIVKAGNNIIQNGADSVITAQNGINLESKSGNIGESEANAIKFDIKAPGGTISANALQGSIYAQTENTMNLDLIAAKDTVSLKTTGTNSDIRLQDSVSGGHVKLNATGDIVKDYEDSKISSTDTIDLIAGGNIGSKDNSLVVSSDGNVSASAKNITLESKDKDLKTGAVTADGELTLTASDINSSVILNGLAKGNSVDITAGRNIEQNSALERSIESATTVNLTAQTGNIGTPKTSDTIANAIDIKADGVIKANAAQGSVVLNSYDNSLYLDNIQAKNDIDLTTTNSGKIVVTNDIITDTGYVRLDSAEKMELSNLIQSSGDVIIGANGGVIQHNGNLESTGVGNVIVTNNGTGEISLNKITTADGDVAINNNAQTDSGVLLNDVVTAGGKGSVTINTHGDISQPIDSVGIIAGGDVTLNADGNVGYRDGDTIKYIRLSADGNVQGSGRQFYIDSVGKSLHTGDINAVNDVILRADSDGSSVILNGLVKGTDVTISANQNITQDASLEKSIEANGNLSLSALNGDIGEAATDDKDGNAIDFSITGSMGINAANGSAILNGVNTNISTDNVRAKNNIDLSTTGSGKISIVNDLSTDTGYIRLNSAEDLEISNNITANGNVILVANNGINQNSGTVKSTGIGKVSFTNNQSGNINLGEVSSNSGGIAIVNNGSSGDVIFNTTVATTNNGDVYIEADRNIIQTFVGDAISSGADVRLVSVTGGIGEDNNALTLKVLPSGKAHAFAKEGSVNIKSVNNNIQFGTVEAGKDINLATIDGGKLTIGEALETNNGNINLNSAENLEINNNISASGNIKIDSHGGIAHTNGAITGTGNGTIQISNDTAGDVLLNKVNTKSGQIDITNSAENANIVLSDEIKSENNSRINITSQGDIRQNGDKVVINSDGEVNLNAKNNIGLVDRFLNIITGNNGKVNASGGSVRLESVNSDLTTGKIAADNGDVQLKTTGTTGSVITSEEITASANVNINAAENITLSDKISAGNDVSLNANGNVTANTEITGSNVTLSGKENVTANNITAQGTASLSGRVIGTDGTISGNSVIYNAVSSINSAGTVSGNDVTMSTTESSLTTNIINATNNVTLRSRGNLLANGAIKGGNTSITSTYGTVTTNGTIDADTLTVNARRNTTIGGEVNAKTATINSSTDVITNADITADSITLDSVGSIYTNKNLNAKNKLSVLSDRGITQASDSTYTMTENGTMTITADGEDLNLYGSIVNEGTGNVNISTKSGGSQKNITVNNLKSNGKISVVNNANGMINITGTIDNNAKNSEIRTASTQSASGINISGTINNEGSMTVTNRGVKGIQVSGDINNGTKGTQSSITLNNQASRGSLTLNGSIINGTQDNKQSTVNLQNSGTGGFNFNSGAMIDNHGTLNVQNSSGNMALWGTLKARLNSKNNFTNTGVVGSANDDVIIGLKLENWGNEITYENTGSGSLIVHENAVLSNFSVEDGDGVHTAVLNLINSGNSSQPGGGIEINGTINNGIVSDGTIVDNSGNLVAAGEIVSGGIVNIENNGTGIKVDEETVSSQRQDDFGIEINKSATINNFAELNIKNNNANSLGSIKIDGTITGDAGKILSGTPASGSAPLPSGSVINIVNNAATSDSGVIFTENAKTDVKGNILNVTNNGQSGIVLESGSLVQGGANISFNNSGESGILFNQNSELSTTGNLNITNTGKNGITLDSGAKVNGGSELYMNNSGENGLLIGNNSEISSTGSMNIVNTGKNGIIADSGSIVKSGKDLKIDNSGENGILVKTGSSLNASGDLLLSNSAKGGITTEKDSTVKSNNTLKIQSTNSDVKVAGVVQGGDVNVEMKNGDLILSHNTTTGNIVSDRNLNVTVTDGDILNANEDGTLENGLGFNVKGNAAISANNIGKFDNALNDIINNGFNQDANNSIHISVNGVINANANNVLNLDGVNSDLNIGNVSAKETILTSNASVNADKISTENLYIAAKGDNSNINVNSLTSTGKVSSESGGNTSVKSDSALNIESMLSKKGSINIESEGNTKIKEIAANDNITINVKDERLDIDTLGRVKRDQNVIPSTVNITVLDSKRTPSAPPQPGMSPDDLEKVTPNSKLSIMHGYAKDKVTLKADTIEAQAYDVTKESQKGDKRIDSDGNAATGFHNANQNGKLLQFDIQGANYFQEDVSDISYNSNYVPDPDDKKALSVHLTMGDSVGNALYGAEFNKLYADYAFIDSVNNSNPQQVANIKLDSTIIGEKAIIRNNKYRLDIDNTTLEYDYPINKHYDDAPDLIYKGDGAFKADINEDEVIINKKDEVPMPWSKNGDTYNPNKRVQDPDLDKLTSEPKAKDDSNKITNSERSTAFREVKWTVRNANNEILGSSTSSEKLVITDIVGVTQDSIKVKLTNANALKKGEKVLVNLEYKDIPCSEEGNIKNISNSVAEIKFKNLDKVTAEILKYVSMYQENL